MATNETRERILDAAAEVIRTRGLARTTTKQIAMAAGYSEATLYKHFTDKEDLFLHVMRRKMPLLIHLLFELPQLAGTGTVAGHLSELCRQAVAFYARTMPMSASMFSEPSLLARYRERLTTDGRGPHVPVVQLGEYLLTEQRLGRISPTVDTHAAASLLLGACFQQAFLATFLGEQPGVNQFVIDSLVTTLMTGIDV
jgi:AcrR family transcriptional regulator